MCGESEQERERERERERLIKVMNHAKPSPSASVQSNTKTDTKESPNHANLGDLRSVTGIFCTHSYSAKRSRINIMLSSTRNSASWM